jgi:hypothetical protein
MMSNVSVEGSCDAAELATPAPRQCFLSRINASSQRQQLLSHCCNLSSLSILSIHTSFPANFATAA